MQTTEENARLAMKATLEHPKIKSENLMFLGLGTGVCRIDIKSSVNLML